MNEEDQFLAEHPEENLLDQPLIPQQEEKQAVEPDPEQQPPEVKNRAHRRLEEKLQAEREANIAMAARLEALSEAKKAREDGLDDLKAIERIYGTDSPEAREATQILKETFAAIEERAVERAYERYQEDRRSQENSVKQEEQQLDAMIDEIEATGVTVSPEAEKGFFRMLEKLSPKDRDGNIIAYADPIATWEQYQSAIKRTDNTAKGLSSRSMTRSSTASAPTTNDDAIRQMLREAGII